MKKKFDINKYIIEKYGLEELFLSNQSLNESFMEELLRGNSQDWEETQELLSKLRVIIPKLIIKILRLGGRTSINFLVASAKRAYRQGKKHKEVLRELLFALICVLVGYTSNTVINNYNSNPVIKGTQIEQKGDSIIVHDKNNNDIQIDQVKDGTVKVKEIKNQPSKKVEKTKKEISKENKSSFNPIRLIGKNENVPTFYHYSEHMVKALAEVESFSPVLYDAKKPNRKTPITKKDMLNPKCDITIGFGHALTASERKNWKPNIRITKHQGLKLYKKDLSQKEIEFNNALRKLPYYNKVVFSQGFIDSFGSLIFNAGVGNICGNGTKPPSEFWNRLCNVRFDKNGVNQNDMNFVISQLKKQNVTEKGHKYRRNAEANIMAMGDNINPKHYHLLAPEFRKF